MPSTFNETRIGVGAIAGLLFLILSTATAIIDGAEPKRLLLLAQKPDGHPRETHEYRGGLKILAELLRPIEELEVTIESADEPWTDGPEKIAAADGVVLFLSEGARWLSAQPRRAEAFARLADRQGGLVVMHWGMGTKESPPIDPFLRLFGGCHGGPDRKYAVVESELTIPSAAANHPALRGLAAFNARDEFYYRLKFAAAPNHVEPLLAATIDGCAEPVAWAWQRPDNGRSFGFSGLHFHSNWSLPQYRRLVAQGTLWTLDLPIPEAGLAVEIDKSVLKLAD